MLEHHHCVCNKMFNGILIFYVLFLTRSVDSNGIQSQTPDIESDNYHSTGSPVSDVKNETESDGQITEDIKLNIQKRHTVFVAPLILTSYVQYPKDAQQLSLVKTDMFFGIKCHSGLLTVNSTYNSHLFFWYFPIEKPVSENPWIIWLPGGPGSSSMDGLFDSFGPFKVIDNRTVARNPHTWLQDHSLMFIDGPVGAGFSYTNDPNGYAKDMSTYTLQLKRAILQLLQLFPELKVAPLFIGSESYGGKYAPALALELHNSIKEDGTEVNLKGIFAGNGIVDPSVLSQVPQTYFERSLLSRKQLQSLQTLKNAYDDDLRNKRSASARTNFFNMVEECAGMSDQNVYNFLNQDGNLASKFGQYTAFITQDRVKRALHVPNLAFSAFNYNVSKMLADEFSTSARPLYNELLNYGYKVMGYCGMWDLLLPCYAASDEYRQWSWKGKQQFIDSSRVVLKFYNEPSGYFKIGGNLTEVQVREAGHFAAMDNPALVQHVVTEWTHGRPPGPYL